nr:MAG TPA: tailspike protein [Caudoviricetes sp.]
MANLKDTLSRVLDPFIDRIAKEISTIKASMDTTKSINVVSYGIDNTGATDVTEKLNELFLKVSKEKYQEVIFPDGTYKIENPVKIFCPEKMSRSLVIRSESTYGATIICDHTDASSGEPIGFILTRNAPENQDGEALNAYNVTIDGFIFKVKNQDVDGSNFKFIGTETTISTLLFTNVKLLNLRMTNTKDCTGNNIDLTAQCNNLTIDNVKTNYGMYAVYLEYSYGINNSISNIVSNNCTFGFSSYSYADFESVTLHFDDNVNLDSGTTANFYANKISNFKLTGRWSLSQNPLYLSVGPRAEISNVELDITLDDENVNHVFSQEKPSAFIYLVSPESAKLEVKVSDLKFEKFQENFQHWIDKGAKFSWINAPELAISPNGVTEYSALTLFENLGSVDEYSSKGFLNRKYEIKAEDSAKTRIYLGYDRTIRGVNISSTDELADGEGSAIFFGVNSVPYKDAKDYDYSNYAAGVAGDVFLESKPNNSGHFGYVSTYRYTTKSEYLPKDDKPISVTNHGDRTMTFGFNKFPIWTNGTLKDTPITVGSIMNVLGKGAFKVIEINVEAKTMKCEIPETYNANVISTLDDLSMEIYFMPDKPVNTMGVMTYETIPIIHSGPTEKRPTEHIAVGQQYFDTTLGLQIVWNGTKWIANNVDIDEKLKEYVRKDSITATDITTTPAFIGQVAVSGGQIYIAKSLEHGGAGWNVIRTESIDTL